MANVRARGTFILLLAILAGAIFVTDAPLHLPLASARSTGIDLGFPIGWYDALSRPDSLPSMHADGIVGAMPYYTPKGDTKTYLNDANASGIQVMPEIPRTYVRNVDTIGVGRFVSRYKSYPALRAWYLADEPTSNRQLGPLRPADATKLYQAIKRADPAHPVAIAFGHKENARAYRRAADIMMFDNYPAMAKRPEFAGLRAWTVDIDSAASMASSFRGFFPVVQGFGGSFGRRLPTLRETRYMVYAGITNGANGLYFWTHYRSNLRWNDRVLRPIVAELQPLRGAMSSGAIRNAVSSSRSDTRVAVFRDARTDRRYLVVVHRAQSKVTTRLRFAGISASQARIVGTDDTTSIPNGAFTVHLGPYDVKVFELS